MSDEPSPSEIRELRRELAELRQKLWRLEFDLSGRIAYLEGWQKEAKKRLRKPVKRR